MFVVEELQNWTVRFEAYNLMKVMVKVKVDTKYFQERGGFTLLHLASLGGYSDIVETIFRDKEIDINEKTEQGDSAIHLASLQDNSVVVDLLLKNRSKIVDANKDGMSPMHVAAANGNKSVLKIIFEKYIADERMETEGSFDQVKVTMMLSIEDDTGKSVLHHASINGHMDVIKLIFSYGIKTSSMQDQDKRYLDLLVILNF